jgi:hypothetical protein
VRSATELNIAEVAYSGKYSNLELNIAEDADETEIRDLESRAAHLIKVLPSTSKLITDCQGPSCTPFIAHTRFSLLQQSRG